jgi:hypothetical protein
VLQIIFNEISAAEMSQLPTELQLEILSEFQLSPEDLEAGASSEHFGSIERDGLRLHRYRARELRIYFQITSEGVLVHRVLHRNTLQDFLYRTSLPMTEDEALSRSKVFWELIEEGRNARRA